VVAATVEQLAADVRAKSFNLTVITAELLILSNKIFVSEWIERQAINF
jgi:hypothetical protein